VSFGVSEEFSTTSIVLRFAKVLAKVLSKRSFLELHNSDEATHCYFTSANNDSLIIYSKEL